MNFKSQILPLNSLYVFRESSSLTAIGTKMKIGSQAHNSGITLPAIIISGANILLTKVRT
jgi:hypothetical protein